MWFLIDASTGAIVSDVVEEEPTPAEGQEAVIVSPLYLMEPPKAVWDPVTRGFIDIIPALLTEWEFRLLFGDAERIGILVEAKTNVIIEDILGLLAAAKNGIDLAHPKVIASVNYLESVELIATGRAAEILAGTPPA
ncbi:hypothetical protein [Sphingomonas sp. DBB INV C78]|uniref:hypothetical protein n=1 Tax=Sphingomonas sp. DBB INV C78 TaxID=3349434 RepID=UPI0036D2940D